MFKSLLVVTALSLSGTALACGSKPCDHCDAPAEASTVDVSKAEGTKVAFTVTGMKCGACSKKITAALEGVEGVNAVAVDHETGKADVAYDAAKTTTEALLAAITALDFQATLVPAKKEG